MAHSQGSHAASQENFNRVRSQVNGFADITGVRKQLVKAFWKIQVFNRASATWEAAYGFGY